MNRDLLCIRTRQHRWFVRTLTTSLTTCAGLLGAASGAFGASSPLSETLSQKHPGDVGIGLDPAVVWYEGFSAGSVAAVVARYNDKKAAGLALVPDHPRNSPGTHAMQFTAGGSTPATDLYKNLATLPGAGGVGFDELFFRYYAKYVGTGPWHHSGLWFSGYNPPLNFPFPHAGSRPAGDDRFHIAIEPARYTSAIANLTAFRSTTNTEMDFYDYWRGMRTTTADPTKFWGNTLIHAPQFVMQSDTWVCYEIHLRLNPNPEIGTGAALEVWENDQLVQSFDDSGPPGYWVQDKFCPNDAQDAPCLNFRPSDPTFVLLDQRWRTTSALKINAFWPQNFNSAAASSKLLFDDMVVARQRIGCTVPK